MVAASIAYGGYSSINGCRCAGHARSSSSRTSSSYPRPSRRLPRAPGTARYPTPSPDPWLFPTLTTTLPQRWRWPHLLTLAPPRQCVECAPLVVAFPLEASSGPYLCSQGVGGALSHFAHPSTRHALDLECPVGTPVIAAGSGVVRSVEQEVLEGGILVPLLFRWNAIVIELDSGETVEYVHVRAHSARVCAGERVRRGQVLCESGDAGFCPVPHLHIEAHASAGRAAPSIPLAFGGGLAAHEDEDDAAREGVAAPAYAAAAPQPPPPPSTVAARHFVPTAGRWYEAHGEVAAPLGPARTALPIGIAHGGLPGRPRGEPSESGDGSSSSGWETVEEEHEEHEEHEERR